MHSGKPDANAELGISSPRLHWWEAILLYGFPIGLLIIFRFLLPAILCDDAYITFKTAVNFASGNGLIFNQGERVYLLTTPLWAFLLAAGRMLFSDVAIAAKILGVLFELLFLCSTVYLGYSLTGSRKAGLLAAVLMCTNPVSLLTGFSGMELPLYLLLLNISFILLSRGRYTWSLVFAAIAVWARFDGILLFAIVLGSTIYAQLKKGGNTPWRVIPGLIPSILLVAAYFIFGLLYYGDLIPVSVQRKVLAGPPLFSVMWAKWAFLVFRELINAFNGKSAYWYVAGTPFWLVWIPLAIGLFTLPVARRSKIIPIVLYIIIYAAALVGSGNSYATNFPWYFVPILPGLYVLSAYGVVWLLSLCVRRLPTVSANIVQWGLVTAIAVIWSAVLFAPLHKDAMNLSGISGDRERMYGAVSIWLGNHLGNGACIAANEIGAIGFFSRPDIAILDMFGLLREREERLAGFVDLIRKHRPEAIVTLEQFNYREKIDEELNEDYFWFKVKNLEIGLRADISPMLQKHFNELQGIYDALDVGKEYDWGLGEGIVTI